MPGPLRWVRRLVPWVVCTVVLGPLVWRYSPHAIAAELGRGGVLAMVPWLAAVVLAALVPMAAADWLVFVAALGLGGPRRLRLVEVARGRAATAIFMILNYGLSSGGYGVWLARRTGAGAGPAVGAATYQMLSDMAAVCLFALPAALLGGRLLPGRVAGPAALLAGTGLVGLVVLLLVVPRAAPARWRASRMLAAWGRVSVAGWAASLLLRAAGLAINVTGTWGAARAFGLHIPIEALAAGLPIIYLVGALPVNVLGLGAVQAVWVALFESHASGARILAFQFAYQLLGAAALVARGLPFLPAVLRDLERGAPEGEQG